MSEGHVGDTRGLGTVSSAADVPGLSMVRGMRGVGGVCEMCMCLAREEKGVSGCESWVLPFLWEQRQCWTCVWVAVVQVGSGLGPGSGGVG